MKRFTAISLLVCFLITATAFGAEMRYSNLDMVQGIGETISNYGIYGDFDSEDLYLKTLVGIMDKHPELRTEILKELLSTKDKYGQYYTPEEKAKVLEGLSDNIEGIGVNITQLSGSLIVSNVIKGTPAEKAGIKSGDIIIAANGISLAGMDIDVATSYIKGPKGTSVNVTIKRGGTEMTLSMIRENITTTPLEYEILDGNIGYIQIHSFSQNTADHFNAALNSFGFKNIKNIIIDVRNNGGGYLSEAVEIADYLLPSGKVITTEDHKIDLLDRKFAAKGPDPNYNTVILINSNSASASEVLCAALTENDAAVSIGKNSYGKGTVQTMVQLPDGGMMKYTTALYMTPSGKNLEGKGIKPDIEVENTTQPIDLTQFTELKYQHSYSVGMSNPEIKNAKEMLAYVGLYHGEINEHFDESLKAAILAIQAASDYIPQTGILDPATQIEILEIMCGTEVVVDNQLETAKAYFAEK